MSEVTKRQVPGDVFFEGLSEINEGALLEALDTKMTSLVSAVLATGNNGSLTLKLSVKRKGGVNQVVIEPKVTASIPGSDDCPAHHVCRYLRRPAYGRPRPGETGPGCSCEGDIPGCCRC